MSRRQLKTVVAGALTGLLAVGGAAAGASLRLALPWEQPGDRPADLPSREEALAAAGLGAEVVTTSLAPGTEELAPADIPGAAAADVRAPAGGRLPDGTFLVGAARASLHPAPEHFGGAAWQTEGCPVTEQFAAGDPTHLLPNPADLVDDARGWPATPPDCIFLGGNGIGPIRAAETVGHGGVWVRSIAISNGERTFVYGIADTVGWFAEYDATVCPPIAGETGCGIRDVRLRLAADLGIGVAEIAMGSTHTHAGPDTYGGWGGIPDWYRRQIRDAAIASAKQAVANMQPATLAAGEVHLKRFNNERRDFYYSNVDTGATWLQATALASDACDGKASRKKAPCEATPAVIATLATYAAHPTIVEGPVLHADWPGAVARAFESTFGGVGLTFEGGLGNASVRGAAGATEQEQAENTGIAMASAIAEDITTGTGTGIIGSNAMDTAVQDITHPALLSNPGLVTLGAVGLFDRSFAPGTDGRGAPGAYYWSKGGEGSSSGEDADVLDPPAPDPGDVPPKLVPGNRLRGCAAAGPTVVTTAGAHRIGGLLIAFAPGEIFSGIAEVVKERVDGSDMTMVLGQTNDALGYIVQSVEFDAVSNPVTHYGAATGEYEEVFALDRCFGDHVLETLLESTDALGFGR